MTSLSTYFANALNHGVKEFRVTLNGKHENGFDFIIQPAKVEGVKANFISKDHQVTWLGQTGQFLIDADPATPEGESVPTATAESSEEPSAAVGASEQQNTEETVPSAEGNDASIAEGAASETVESVTSASGTETAQGGEAGESTAAPDVTEQGETPSTTSTETSNAGSVTEPAVQ